MKKITAIFIILLAAFITPVSGEEVYIDKYVAPDGIEVISHTETWKGDQLEAVYQELLQNTHGEEISYLSSVHLHGGQSPNGTEEGLYSYTLQKRNYLISSSVRLQNDSSIHLYHMEEKRNVADIARVLSHEYGHHFTIYYLAKNDSEFFQEWEKSDFYLVRQGSIYEEMSDDPETEHRWAIAEICAEDYVQLYGSPLAKEWEKVYDIEERVDRGYLSGELTYSSQSFNIIPQENMEIPLALEVETATSYWEGLTGITPNKEQYTNPELVLGKRTTVDGGYIKQELEWTSSTDVDGKEALYYTLVAMNSETGQFLPIKSVPVGEERKAVVGAVSVSTRRGYSVYTDSFAEQLGENGYDDLRIIAIGEKGEAVASASYLYDFSSGTLSSISEEAKGIVQYTSINENESNDNRVMKIVDRFMDWLFSMFERFFDEPVA